MDNVQTGSIHDWVGTLQTIVIWFGIVGSIILAFWRRIYRTYLGLCTVIGLRDRFGDSPGEAIHTMLQIAARARSENALKIDILARVNRVGIYICDTSGLCTATNGVLCELFGRDSKDMLGKGWLGAVIEKDRYRVEEEWRNSLQFGLPYRASYTIHNDRHNVTVECVSEAYAIIDKNGVVSGFVGWVTPIETPDFLKD